MAGQFVLCILGGTDIGLPLPDIENNNWQKDRGLRGPLVLAVIPLFWVHSIVAELYAPASAFIALIILTILMWRTTDHTRYLTPRPCLADWDWEYMVFIVFMLPGIFVYLVLNLKSRRAWLGSVAWAIFGAAFTLIAFYILDRTDTNAGYYHVTVRHALSVWG